MIISKVHSAFPNADANRRPSKFSIRYKQAKVSDVPRLLLRLLSLVVLATNQILFPIPSGLCPSFWQLQRQLLPASSSPFTALLLFGELHWSTNRINIGSKPLRRKRPIRTFVGETICLCCCRLFGIPAEFFVTLYVNNGHEWKW